MHTLIKTCRRCAIASKEGLSRYNRIRFAKYSTSVTENKEKESTIQSHTNQNKYFSFMKNLFTGKMDTNILVFPEPLEEEDLNNLNKTVKIIEDFYTENVESATLDKNGKMSPDLIEKLKEFGLFGQSIPKEYGGMAFSATERCRILEVLSLDSSLAITLSSHQDFAAKCIENSGTSEQKEKYLPIMASGKCIGAFCLSEKISGSDISNIETIAVHNEENSTFTLSGRKHFVVNGNLADVYVVFARVPTINTLGDTEYDVTAFLVDKDTPGIHTSNGDSHTGVKAADVCGVNFDNVVIHESCRLDEIGQGFKVALQVINDSRIMMATNGISILKKLLGDSIEHSISTEHYGEKLMHFGLVQDRLVRVACDIYAMESMAYLTSSIVDTNPSEDVSLETAALRIFSSQKTVECIRDCHQIYGTGACVDNLPFSRYLRDAEVFASYETSNDMLRLYLSITSLQYAVDELKEIIRKIRDPFNNVGFIFKHGFQTKGLSTSVKNKLKLHDHVHPHLSFLAETLEGKITDLVKVIEKFVLVSKDGILKETMSLQRFADIGIDMYACTAVLGRASRSFSIGLQHSDHEIYLTRAFCNDAFKRIDKNIEEISMSKFNNGDEEKRKCAEQMLKNHGYTAVHPLTRNW